MVDGAAVVPQAGVADPQVAERSALALAVPDLAGDGQGLLVMVDGAAVVPQAVVAVAQVAERSALALAVPDLAGDGQGLLVMVDGAAVVPQAVVAVAQVVRLLSISSRSVRWPFRRSCSPAASRAWPHSSR